MKQVIEIILAVGLLLPVAVSARSKAIEHRAWLGGEFTLAQPGGEAFSAARVGAFPCGLGQRSGVLVGAVHPETPLAAAGVAAGDLILALDGKPVTSSRMLLRAVESRAPGDIIRLSVYRDGEVEEHTATLGTEAFERWHTVSFGLMVNSRIDLVPKPDFSAFALGFKRSHERIDLRSPSVEFFRRHRQGPGVGHGLPGRESWQAWCVLFGVGGHTQIVSQERFPAQPQQASLR